MKKIFSLFVIFIYLFMSSSLVHAKSMNFLNNKKTNHTCHSISSNITNHKTSKDKKPKSMDCRETSSTQNNSTASTWLVKILSFDHVQYNITYPQTFHGQYIPQSFPNKSPPLLQKNFKSDTFTNLVGIVKISVFIA